MANKFITADDQHYSEIIYQLQQAGEEIYETIGYLRDAGTPSEKDFANKLRGIFQQAYSEFSKWNDCVKRAGRGDMML